MVKKKKLANLGTICAFFFRRVRNRAWEIGEKKGMPMAERIGWNEKEFRDFNNKKQICAKKWNSNYDKAPR